jgi:hypothetical protein
MSTDTTATTIPAALGPSIVATLTDRSLPRACLVRVENEIPAIELVWAGAAGL